MKIVLVIIFMVIGSFNCISQDIINKSDTTYGFFLMESFWEESEYTYRSFILPINIRSIFGNKNDKVAYSFQNTDLDTFNDNIENNARLSEIHFKILQGNSSNIDFKKPKELFLGEQRYYLFYLKFTYKKGEYEKRRFPKVNSKNKVKRMSLRKVQVNQIINVLEIEW